MKKFNEEPKYHVVAARMFANALSNFLQEDEGIIAQGEDEDGILHKVAVWLQDGKIRFTYADSNDVIIGKKFWMHDDEAEAITKATLDGVNVIILD